jgi:hypothetical protein
LPSADGRPDEVTDIRQEGEMKSLILLTAACVVSLASLGLAAQASSPGSYSGNADYQVFCASCHGASGKGDGVIAGSLRKRPADLTQLSKRHDGVFPAEAVFTTIEADMRKTTCRPGSKYFRNRRKVRGRMPPGRGFAHSSSTSKLFNRNHRRFSTGDCLAR